MTPQILASKLAVWSKRKIPYDSALIHAKSYLAGTLGDGIIKEFFMTVYIVPVTTTNCHIPTCTNQSEDIYCTACTNMIPGSAVVGLLRDLGEFLCGRQSP